MADRGFVVDATFRQQTVDNKARFCGIHARRVTCSCPVAIRPPSAVSSKTPTLPRRIGFWREQGTRGFLRGALAAEIVATVQAPPKVPTSDRAACPGRPHDDGGSCHYRDLEQAPTHVNYRGYDVYGMAPSSSGGTTVGEALNILEPFNLSTMTRPQALHHYLEASALAFADRGKYVGDPAFVDVPTEELTDPLFGKERACEIDPLRGGTPSPSLQGTLTSYDGVCTIPPAAAADETDTENISTTNLTVADKWGNVVEYTLTIEQTGGSGIVVPGRGFLLNNELTDFSYTSTNPTDPNRIEPGKRPRSSMSPTIILNEGKPFLALGSPGGSTIITTVLQTILNRVDLGMTSSRRPCGATCIPAQHANVTAEPDFISTYGTELAPTAYWSPAGTPSPPQQKSAPRQPSSSVPKDK